MIRLESVEVYSCLADSVGEASHVLVEIHFSDGTILEGKMNPEAAKALSADLAGAAMQVEKAEQHRTVSALPEIRPRGTVNPFKHSASQPI
jgi:hypothetical protein